MKQQTLFSGKWVQTTPIPTTEPSRPKLRGSQPAAFQALKDAKCAILNAPTGWGKSIVIIFLVCYKLLRNRKLRCIIAVPQTLIGRNFVNGGRNVNWCLKIPGIRKLVDWIVNNNLCDEQANDTIRSLVSFLKGPHRLFGNRVLVCTHATLAHAYKRLKKQRRLSLLKNTIVWIDEAHHVMNAQMVGRKDTISNCIGRLVKYCLAKDNHVGLATATFMRGDLRHILSDAMQKMFTRFNVPYDVYFETMQPVESFEFNVVCGDVLKAIGSLRHRPTIIYIAKRQSRYAGSCKYKEVRQIVKTLARGQKVSRQGALILAGNLKVLDLVTEKGRSKRKAYLDNGGQVDIIIALDTCKEGFDWPEAEQCVIIGERHSIPEMIQMIGRLFRRCEGKKHAAVYQILPAVVSDSKRFKDHCNANLTVIFSAMLLEEVFLPLTFSDEPKKRKRRDIDRFISTLPDTDTWQSICRDFLASAHEKDFDQAKRLALSILKRHGVPKADWEVLWRRLWSRCAIITRRQKGLRLDVPFEVLKKTDLTEGLLKLMSGLCGVEIFQELRKMIGRETVTIEEYVIRAEEYAAQNADGSLEAAA